MKDVTIKPDAPQTLLLEKHGDFIASYSAKKQDYVSTIKKPTDHEMFELKRKYCQLDIKFGGSNTDSIFVQLK